MKIRIWREEQLKDIALIIKQRVKKGDLVIFSGELGAGKTTLIKHICSLYGIDPDRVKSPSFSIQNIYPGPTMRVNHYDLYRVADIDDLELLNLFEDMEDALTLIEWGSKFIDVLGCHCTLMVSMGYLEGSVQGREIIIGKGGKEG